ncbi:hypothetical protein [Flexithrix dorotheae]|uniref:hypothetical protein n=1 Tax=Flexithrix dorotheae TaxID=70993 RepID=UPI000367F26E|nr:hypothetical protein [Flexithrix dorotheae]
MEQELRAEEKRAKIVGIISTIVICSLLIFMILNVVVWRPSIEPLNDMGIEVNFGNDLQGSGDIQSKSIANDNKSLDEAKPQPIQETPVNEPTPVQPQVTPPAQEVVETEAPQEIVAATDAEVEESVVATPKEEVKEKPKEEPNEPVEEPPKEEPKQVVNPATTLGGTGTSNEAKPNSNGNTTGTGDMGDPTGSVNADALLGKSTGQGGSSLEMPGWRWESPPVVNDQSSVTGRIEFEVKIDEDGEVVSVQRVMSSVVDRDIIAKYQQSVYDLVFTPVDPGASRSRLTKGKITFIITAK